MEKGELERESEHFLHHLCIADRHQELTHSAIRDASASASVPLTSCHIAAACSDRVTDEVR